MPQTCENFIDGRRVASRCDESMDVTNPATGAAMALLPLATAGDVDQAVASAAQAFETWGKTPVLERARVLFRFKAKLEEHRRELVELIVADNGKTLAEARGSVQRGIEGVEFATGIPSLAMGTMAEELTDGIDCQMVRQPLGVVAGLTPFNFPVMVPLWTIPIALGCGNTYVLKPSERAPLAAVRLAELLAECGAPKGTLNVVHGTRAVAESLMAHPDVKAVSVVGSSPVAKSVYETSASHGKRVQALGGAKNALIVMPDADLDMSVESITASVFGCAGQRCLAGANVVAVGDVARPLLERLTAAANALRLGSGLDPKTTMGPVITQQAKQRIDRYVDQGVKQGARLVRDGRADRVPDLPGGYFVGPTVFDDVQFDMTIATDEIFGPVLNVLHAGDLDEAIERVNTSPLGNSASIYTTSGHAARQFRRTIEVGMLGVNLGVPAPMAPFPFSGWKGSFFGDLHAQGRDGIEFYTRRKVITARWP